MRRSCWRRSDGPTDAGVRRRSSELGAATTGFTHSLPENKKKTLQTCEP